MTRYVYTAISVIEAFMLIQYHMLEVEKPCELWLLYMQKMVAV